MNLQSTLVWSTEQQFSNKVVKNPTRNFLALQKKEAQNKID